MNSPLKKLAVQERASELEELTPNMKLNQYIFESRSDEMGVEGSTLRSELSRKKGSLSSPGPDGLLNRGPKKFKKCLEYGYIVDGDADDGSREGFDERDLMMIDQNQRQSPLDKFKLR